jgi:DNA topoisomerase-2
MTENVVKKLTSREHILRRPGMYLGSVEWNKEEIFILNKDRFELKKTKYIPAFIKLFDEVISNAIDEGIRTKFKFSNRISVKVVKDRIIVEDNGRGISSEKEKRTKLPQSVVAFTHARAGTNFTNDTSTIGQNGVGAWGVNVFSKKFKVDTANGKTRTILKCSKNLEVAKHEITKSKDQYTKIEYTPDYDRFKMNGLDDVHLNLIHKRVLDLSICYPQIQFKFNARIVSVKSFKDYIKMFGGAKPEIFTFKNVDIGLIPNDDFNQVSFVNGVETKRGGEHLNYAVASISSTLRELIVKKYKSIKPLDIKNKMLFVVNVRNMKAPRFDSQTKEKLINTQADFKVLFNDIDFDKLAKKVRTNDDIIFPIIETFKIKEEMKKRQQLAKKEKSAGRKRIPKLVEASSKERDKCSLFIMEGDSAVTSFLSVRGGKQKNFLAAYPLRGKFLNVYDMESNKVIKNNEVQELLSILGLRLSDSDITDLRYGRIMILADQDTDGDSITCQLINFFQKYWPGLAEEGKLFKVMSPLLKVKTDKGEIKTYYNLETYKEEMKPSWKVLEYNKGLGGLEDDSYREMINNPVLYKVVADKEAKKNLKLAFSDNIEDRKGWLLNE